MFNKFPKNLAVTEVLPMQIHAVNTSALCIWVEGFTFFFFFLNNTDTWESLSVNYASRRMAAMRFCLCCSFLYLEHCIGPVMIGSRSSASSYWYWLICRQQLLECFSLNWAIDSAARTVKTNKSILFCLISHDLPPHFKVIRRLN